MKKRRFFILDNYIAAQELPKLLGRLTLNYKNPFDSSVPEDPSACTEGQIQGDISEKAAKIWHSAANGSKIKVALKPFATVVTTEDGKTEETLQSALIETHRLGNHAIVFGRLMEKFHDEIQRLIDSEAIVINPFPERLYMVIGYKCITDARRAYASDKVRSMEVDVSVPVGAAANIVAPGTIPVDAQAEGELGRQSSGSLVTDSTIQGTVGFAVEYRTFWKSCILAMIKKESWDGVTMGSVNHWREGTAMGDGGDGGDASESESDQGSNPFLLELGEKDAQRYELCRVGDEEYLTPKK